MTGLGLLREEAGLGSQVAGEYVRSGDLCEGMAVPEADGNRVDQLGAHRPRDKQVLLVLKPKISWR